MRIDKKVAAALSFVLGVFLAAVLDRLGILSSSLLIRMNFLSPGSFAIGLCVAALVLGVVSGRISILIFSKRTVLLAISGSVLMTLYSWFALRPIAFPKTVNGYVINPDTSVLLLKLIISAVVSGLTAKRMFWRSALWMTSVLFLSTIAGLVMSVCPGIFLPGSVQRQFFGHKYESPLVTSPDGTRDAHFCIYSRLMDEDIALEFSDRSGHKTELMDSHPGRVVWSDDSSKFVVSNGLRGPGSGIYQNSPNSLEVVDVQHGKTAYCSFEMSQGSKPLDAVICEWRTPTELAITTADMEYGLPEKLTKVVTFDVRYNGSELIATRLGQSRLTPVRSKR